MKILMPLPSHGFDPTETAVPWHVLTQAGHDVRFITPDGKPADADPRMLSGKGLFFWSPILRARSDARLLYKSMVSSEAFQNPTAYNEAMNLRRHALVLAGGHAPEMKTYLESTAVRELAAAFFEEDKPVGAICHGVVVLARTQTGAKKSVLFERKTTALTQSMEMSAFAMTGLWLGNYYRTYPQTVQNEVVEACGSSSLFEEGPFALFRDTPDKLQRGFTVRDRNYLSARWPGDAYRFANEFAELLAEP